MKNLIGSSCLILAAILWGTSQVFSKYVLEEVPPFTLTFLRFILASIVLGFILVFQSPVKIHRKDLVKLSFLGFIGYTLSIGLQLTGIQMSTAHNATVITSTPPLFMFLFSTLFLHERVSWKKGVALIVSTIGVGIVIGGDFSTGEHTLGNIFLVLAAVSWALYSVLIKPYAEKYTSTVATFYSLLFASVFSFPFSLYEYWTHNFILVPNHSVWLGVLYIGIIATGVGFWIWNKGVHLLETNSAGLFLFVQPVIGSFLAWQLLGEHLATTFYYGSLLIVAGITISQLEIKTLPRAILVKELNSFVKDKKEERKL